MRTQILKSTLLISSAIAMFGCGEEQLTVEAPQNPTSGTGNTDVELVAQPLPTRFPTADNGDALLGNADYPAISYGAWRSTVRADGADVPSVDMQKEDMQILAAMGIKMIRTYNTQGFIGLDGKSNTENLLQAIAELKQDDPSFEMYVMLGVWIDALNSFSDQTPDPFQNNPSNFDEMDMAKQLASEYPDIVKVIAVGNEAMVEWAPYHVVPGIILEHVEDLQTWKQLDLATQDIWITSSDNHAVWAGDDANGNNGEQADLKALIEAVDYISLHTYAMHDTHYHPAFSEEWKVPESEQDLTTQEQVDSAMERAYQHTLSQFKAAQVFVNSVDATKPIHIGETGWTTVSTDGMGEGGTQAAGEYQQKSFYDDMREFSNDFGASLFFFQAFDEPWKGDNANPSHSEQHFGLIDITGNVKYVAWDKVDALTGLSRGTVQTLNASYSGDLPTLLDDLLPPPYAPIATPPAEGEFVVLGATAYANSVVYGWDNPLTAWAGVNADTGVMTVVTDPAMAKDWGWGAGIGNGDSPVNLSGSQTMTFEIRGIDNADSALATFPFYLGFETTAGRDHWVRFNAGQGYVITSDWQTISIPLSQFSQYENADLSAVTSPFTIADKYAISGGSAPLKSNIEVRNISWLE